MRGNLARLHHPKRIAKKSDGHRIELATPAKKGDQSAAHVRIRDVCDGNTAGSRPSDERLAVEGAPSKRSRTVKHLGCEDSVESSQGPLSGPPVRGLTFPNLKAITLSPYRSHSIRSLSMAAIRFHRFHLA